MNAVSDTAAAEPLEVGATSTAALSAGVGLVVAIGLVVLAARHASPAEVSPVVPRDEWRAVWDAGLVLSFALYGAGAWFARTGRLRVQAALAIAVAVQALPLAAPLLLSKDVYLYWAEARVATVHHANPYVSTPADFPKDEALPLVSESWRAEPSPYGPGWEAVSALPALAARASAHRAEILYRLLAFVAMLGSLALVARRTQNAAAVAFLGWSPLLALHYAGGGHGDAVMMVLVLGAIAASTSRTGGALWPLASAFKPFPPVLVPLELARRKLEMGARWWTGFVGSTVVVAGAATAVFGTHWVRAATTGAHQASPLGGVHWLMQLGLAHRSAVLCAAAAFLCVYAMLLRSAWTTGRARFSLAASALCIASSLLRPWYALWPVALAAFEDDVVAAVVAYALSAYLLFGDAVHL